AGYDAWLKDLADEHEMDVWIFGPLESDAIPLRVPAGHDESEAQELGAQVWPSWYLQTTGVAQVPRIAEFEDAVARIGGGPVGTMYAASWMYQMSSSVYMTGGDVAPPSIAFLVVWDEMPVEPPGVLRSVWHAWQVFVARHTRPIMGSGYLLMLVSLVLSPTAFVIDRGRRIRVRAAEERERMHRDAHDKVYNRLSALSKRVAEVGGAATNGTAGSLGAIAEEIRYTVGELQEILGDDVEHTSSAFADVPMADQLAAVCGAQAASLGVSVQCDVGPGVPLVSPRLGWDLQCIAEEAITNAVRHGDASRVRVHLDLGASDTVVLVVTDDGCGTSVTSADVTAESSTGLR
ncbi:MAG: hypothetical protein JXP37_06810, partial [Coriobacteriia bacterium]|nr:hypothetical protein [Coriobacteriia bacterium]